LTGLIRDILNIIEQYLYYSCAVSLKKWLESRLELKRDEITRTVKYFIFLFFPLTVRTENEERNFGDENFPLIISLEVKVLLPLRTYYIQVFFNDFQLPFPKALIKLTINQAIRNITA
jgi:hypothetical protein